MNAFATKGIVLSFTAVMTSYYLLGPGIRAGSIPQVLFGLTVIVGLVFDLVLIHTARGRHTWLAIDYALGAAIFCSIAALLVSSKIDHAIMGVIAGVLLAIRSLTLFVYLPRYSRMTYLALCQLVLRCVAISGTLLSVTILILAARSGYPFFSAVRLHNHYAFGLHANEVANFSSVGLLSLLLAEGFKKYWRWLAIGIVSLTILFTQSRTSLGGLALTVPIVLLLGKRLTFPKVLAGGLVILVLGLALGSRIVAIASASAIAAGMSSRSVKGDITSGRALKVEEAWTQLSEQPLFGYGLRAQEFPIENGYLSMGLESGLIGMAMYLLLLVGVFRVGWRHLRVSGSTTSRTIGKACIAFTILMSIRGLGERSHGFLISDLGSNVWMIMAGIACWAWYDRPQGNPVPAQRPS